MSDPFDPFEEARKQRRLLDDAMGGSVERFYRDERERQKTYEQCGIAKTVQEALDRQNEQQRLLEQMGIAQTVRDALEVQKERERMLEPYRERVIQEQTEEEKAFLRRVSFGSISAARMFQENIFAGMAVDSKLYAEIARPLQESGVLERIAEQQSALVKASLGIGSQIGVVQEAMRAAGRSIGQFSATSNIQSALSDQLLRISEQIRDYDSIGTMGGIRDSSSWETLRKIYEIDEAASLSETFLEIGTKIEAQSGNGLSLTPLQIWRIIEALITLLAFYAMVAGWGDYTAEDRERDVETAERLARMELNLEMEQVQTAIAEASALAEITRINSLPKAYILNAANVRAEPKNNAERVARLDQNVMVAVEEKRGRWFRVLYAELPTQDLAEGWVWQGSVELL